jgi:hypothetical protein
MSKENRNAFELLAIINRTMKRRGESKEKINEVLKDMQSSDYEHLVEVFNKNK